MGKPVSVHDALQRCAALEARVEKLEEMLRRQVSISLRIAEAHKGLVDSVAALAKTDAKPADCIGTKTVGP